MKGAIVPATNVNERLVEQIDALITHVPTDSEDHRVLTYVREQITAEGIEARNEWSKDVTPLHQAAADRMRRYQPKGA